MGEELFRKLPESVKQEATITKGTLGLSRTLDEAERRLAEYRAGKVKGVSAAEVFQRAMAELS